jgi:hypothetical protein
MVRGSCVCRGVKFEFERVAALVRMSNAFAQFIDQFRRLHSQKCFGRPLGSCNPFTICVPKYLIPL